MRDFLETLPRYGDRFPSSHRLIDGDIGYLRIASMESDGATIEALLSAMERFGDTSGLVIDVRGNGGGSRDILLRLFPYLPPASDGPVVANVSRYRLREGEAPGAPEGYHADRFLFPEASAQWSAAERNAIRSFARGFRPEWTPPSGSYSDWHYVVLGDTGRGPRRPYRRGVVVLEDADCYSATDIFLSALQGLRGITLMGGPSGGGSGRAIPVTLEHSQLTVRLSSMISYRRDGRLLDGNGVVPDVPVEPRPEDFVGRSDSVLDAALQRLKGK